MLGEHNGHGANDHYYLYGDVYEAIDACHEVERLLGRLRRQQLLDDRELARGKADVADILEQVERHLEPVG